MNDTDAGGTDACYLLIEGQRPLRGTITPNGSKNASLPLIATACLSDQVITLEHLPDIIDTDNALQLAASSGFKVDAERRSAAIGWTGIDREHLVLEPKFASKIRASYYFLGALLPRFASVTLQDVGGCSIGERPIDLHFQVFGEMGCSVERTRSGIVVSLDKTFQPTRRVVSLPFQSRGATINALLLGSQLPGSVLEIRNANQSPECIAVQDALLALGVPLTGRGASTVVVIGKSRGELSAARLVVPSDKIEAATLLIAGVLTGGNVVVEGVDHPSIAAADELLREMRIETGYEAGRWFVTHVPATIGPAAIRANFDNYRFDADFEPVFAVLAATASGQSVIEDTINPGRHANYLRYLRTAGCTIEDVSPTMARITGPTRWTPFSGRAEDIRGGIAQVLAALIAPGKSEIHGVSQIYRGYSDIDRQLTMLGGEVALVHPCRPALARSHG